MDIKNVLKNSLSVLFWQAKMVPAIVYFKSAPAVGGVGIFACTFIFIIF